MFDNITKYFIVTERATSFEIDVKTEDAGREYILRNYQGNGEVKLIVKHYRLISSTPYIICK